MSELMPNPSSWSAVAPLTPNASGLASPSIAVSKSGLVHVLYEDGEDIWHLVQDQGRWAAPAWVAGGSRPSVFAYGDDLHLVFANEFAGNVEVYYGVWTGGGWSLPRNLSYTSGASSQPRIALGADGIPHVVWTDDTPGYSTVYHGHRADTYWINRPVTNGRGESPWLAVDTQGLVHIVWQDRQPADGPWQVYYTRGDGRHWSLPQNLSASDQQDAASALVLLDTQDQAHVMWREQADGLHRIMLSFRVGNHWTEPETLVETPSNVDNIQAAFTAQGTLHLAWLEEGQVRHRYRGPGGVLSQTELLGQAGDAVMGMALSLVPQRWEAHLVWVLDQPQGRVLQHSQREPALPHRQYLPMDETDAPATESSQ